MAGSRNRLIVTAVVALLMGGGTALAQNAAAKPKPPPVVPPAAEGPRIELTLPEAVALGLRDNRTIRAAQIDRILQKFELRVAEDRFTPKLTVSASYLSRRDQGEPGSSGNLTPVATLTTPVGTQIALSWANTTDKVGGAQRASASNLNLAVIQPLLRNGGLDANMAPVRIAQLDEKVNRLALKATVARTVTEIVQAYRAFVHAQEQLRISRESLARSRELLSVNRALIEAGRMAEVEVVQTESDAANQELAVEQALNGVDSARLALLEKLALDPRTDVVASERIAVQPVRVPLERALALTFDSQPEYLAQMIAVERARLGLGVAKNGRLWDVSAVAGTGAMRQDPANPRLQRNSYGGLQMVVPLGDLNAEKAEVAAGVAAKTADLRLEAVRQQVEHQTRDAVRNVETRWRQYEIARRALGLASRKVEIEREKLQVGRSSNFQVLSYEADLRAAESIELGAMIGYLNALTILDQQVGTTLDTWQISLED
ncbi:MAG: TolC family protein [Solirubrobacterales bacterium]